MVTFIVGKKKEKIMPNRFILNVLMVYMYPVYIVTKRQTLKQITE